MTLDDYRNKYGDTRVMGVDRAIVVPYLKDGFTHRRDTVLVKDSEALSFSDWIQQNLKSMLRCEAECNPIFKQIIPYVLLEHKPTGRYYMTTRIGGDERLLDQASLGLGGHIDEGESIQECLWRELNEEIGLSSVDCSEPSLLGYLFSEKNEVDSVHLGMVYRISTERENISCLEKDKLLGGWFSPQELKEVRASSHLESWSRTLFDSLLKEKADGQDQ